MAANKKYAGLPDLDADGTELYQTPGLTDDASTVQTSTVRTESPTPSEEDRENFDRTQYNREQARRRFEPAVVDARDVNFSHAVGRAQKSYTLRNRRQRRIRRGDGTQEYGNLSDDDEFDRVETLAQKLARLKREAEEVRLELERQEKDDGEFQDSFEHLQGGAENEDNDGQVSQGLNDLNQILVTLQTSIRRTPGKVEQEFMKRLEAESMTDTQPVTAISNDAGDIQSSFTINTITSFADRLTAIESALGLSSITPASNPTAILPTLSTLTTQIDLLTSTISPKQPLSAMTSNTTMTTTAQPPQMPHLDVLQSRLHTLHQSATSLLSARKAAQTALTELETVRLRGIRHSDNLSRYNTLANRRVKKAPTTNGPTNTLSDDDEPLTARPMSRNGNTAQGRKSTVTEEAKERVEIADEIMTPLFLEEQAEKIKALYNVLPTIQDLQPLLPVVLERLRGLSVVHAGAAEARNDMDEIEGRLRDWEAELDKWRDALGGVEKGIEEVKVVMKENVAVVGGLVRGVEMRVEELQG